MYRSPCRARVRLLLQTRCTTSPTNTTTPRRAYTPIYTPDPAVDHVAALRHADEVATLWRAQPSPVPTLARGIAAWLRFGNDPVVHTQLGVDRDELYEYYYNNSNNNNNNNNDNNKRDNDDGDKRDGNDAATTPASLPQPPPWLYRDDAAPNATSSLLYLRSPFAFVEDYMGTNLVSASSAAQRQESAALWSSLAERRYAARMRQSRRTAGNFLGQSTGSHAAAVDGGGGSAAAMLYDEADRPNTTWAHDTAFREVAYLAERHLKIKVTTPLQLEHALWSGACEAAAFVEFFAALQQQTSTRIALPCAAIWYLDGEARLLWAQRYLPAARAARQFVDDVLVPQMQELCNNNNNNSSVRSLDDAQRVLLQSVARAWRRVHHIECARARRQIAEGVRPRSWRHRRRPDDNDNDNNKYDAAQCRAWAANELERQQRAIAEGVYDVEDMLDGSDAWKREHEAIEQLLHAPLALSLDTQHAHDDNKDSSSSALTTTTTATNAAAALTLHAWWLHFERREELETQHVYEDDRLRAIAAAARAAVYAECDDDDNSDDADSDDNSDDKRAVTPVARVLEAQAVAIERGYVDVRAGVWRPYTHARWCKLHYAKYGASSIVQHTHSARRQLLFHYAASVHEVAATATLYFASKPMSTLLNYASPYTLRRSLLTLCAAYGLDHAHATQQPLLLGAVNMAAAEAHIARVVQRVARVFGERRRRRVAAAEARVTAAAAEARRRRRGVGANTTTAVASADDNNNDVDVDEDDDDDDDDDATCVYYHIDRVRVTDPPPELLDAGAALPSADADRSSATTTSHTAGGAQSSLRVTHTDVWPLGARKLVCYTGASSLLRRMQRIEQRVQQLYEHERQQQQQQAASRESNADVDNNDGDDDDDDANVAAQQQQQQSYNTSSRGDAASSELSALLRELRALQRRVRVEVSLWRRRGADERAAAAAQRARGDAHVAALVRAMPELADVQRYAYTLYSTLTGDVVDGSNNNNNDNSDNNDDEWAFAVMLDDRARLRTSRCFDVYLPYTDAAAAPLPAGEYRVRLRLFARAESTPPYDTLSAAAAASRVDITNVDGSNDADDDDGCSRRETFAGEAWSTSVSVLDALPQLLEQFFAHNNSNNNSNNKSSNNNKTLPTTLRGDDLVALCSFLRDAGLDVPLSCEFEAGQALLPPSTAAHDNNNNKSNALRSGDVVLAHLLSLLRSNSAAHHSSRAEEGISDVQRRVEGHCRAHWQLYAPGATDAEWAAQRRATLHTALRDERDWWLADPLLGVSSAALTATAAASHSSFEYDLYPAASRYRHELCSILTAHGSSSDSDSSSDGATASSSFAASAVVDGTGALTSLTLRATPTHARAHDDHTATTTTAKSNDDEQQHTLTQLRGALDAATRAVCAAQRRHCTLSMYKTGAYDKHAQAHAFCSVHGLEVGGKYARTYAYAVRKAKEELAQQMATGRGEYGVTLHERASDAHATSTTASQRFASSTHPEQRKRRFVRTTTASGVDLDDPTPDQTSTWNS